MKLAIVGPVPPVRSGIADFVAELLPHLSRHAEVSLLVDGVRPTDEVRQSVSHVVDLRDRLAAKVADEADAVVVQLGNDPIHGGAYEFFLARAEAGKPAVLELHEFVLGHFAAALWFEPGLHDRYLLEARIGHGREGERIAREEVLERRLGLWDADPWRLPMSGRAIRAAAGVVVHSRFLRRRVWGVRPEAPVAVIPHAALPPDGFPSRDEARRRRGIESGAFVVTSTGFVVPAKRLDGVVEALAGLGTQIPWTFRICGEAVAGESVVRRARELGVEERVVLTGYLPRPALVDEMAATDLLVNLREPTLGESSGSVARILSAGAPVVVTDVGWYGELPDEVVFKVPAGEAMIASLRVLVSELAVDPERKRRTSSLAAAFARREWSIERVARLYVDELPRLAAGALPADRLVAQLSLAAASLGVTPIDTRVSASLGRAVEFVLGRPVGGA